MNFEYHVAYLVTALYCLACLVVVLGVIADVTFTGLSGDSGIGVLAFFRRHQDCRILTLVGLLLTPVLFGRGWALNIGQSHGFELVVVWVLGIYGMLVSVAAAIMLVGDIWRWKRTLEHST